MPINIKIGSDRCVHNIEEFGCPIANSTVWLDVHDPDYPNQWQMNNDGSDPVCTAFNNDSESKVAPLLPLSPEQKEWLTRTIAQGKTHATP